MARLYFSICPFAGRVYRGLDYVNHLITLGSPHYNRRGSWMRRWVDRQYPGAHFAPAVRYSAVAGRGVRGDRRGSLRQRWAYRAYKQLAGEGDTWGDGLVPVSSALLDGALPVVLDGVTHHAAFGHPWYGSRDIVLLWWQASLGAEGVP
jgi:hypothetical protein